MILLFDQGTPLPLRTHLPGHTVVSAFEKGWSELENGELLAAAESEGFDALITTDQNLQISAKSCRKKDSRPCFANCKLAADKAKCLFSRRRDRKYLCRAGFEAV